ncbi:hypothetical protein [Rhizobium sullae]|uniref:Uncharacterized protein n=1 Tax=Rhizobium sullae TaxID=50338 RepID=A0A4R3Q0G3_RHISU|nr:hypothetical protein [Rhizobium sullae]TCU14488.1 hypothetical protein EV132_109211 [Rhizobium sullae]
MTLAALQVEVTTGTASLINILFMSLFRSVMMNQTARQDCVKKRVIIEAIQKL